MNKNEEISTLYTALTVSGVIGLVVGIARGVILQRHGSVGALLRGAVASALVAVLVSGGLEDSSLSLNMRISITGVCAFIADDILLGLLSLGQLLGKDPLGFLSRFVAAYRGVTAAQPQVHNETKKEGD